MRLRQIAPIFAIVVIAIAAGLVILSNEMASSLPAEAERPTVELAATGEAEPEAEETEIEEPEAEELETEEPETEEPEAETEEPEAEEAEEPETETPKAGTVPAGGGVFLMGTNAEEIAAALSRCAPEDNCDTASADDSMPEHYVSLSPYQVELYEISNADYVAFLNTLGAGAHLAACLDEQCILTQEEDPASNITFDGETYTPVPDADNLPVAHVSWYGAQAYCESFGRRLPSEAEWELVARGSYGSIYPWGIEFDPNRANIAVSGNGGLTPVDSYPGGRSHYGIENMVGNAAEWTLDWYGADFYSAGITGEGAGSGDAAEVTVSNDPTGPETGEMRVTRGGSWQDVPFYARAPQRAAQLPEAMLPTVGFRCAESDWPLPDAPLAEALSIYEGLEAGTLEDGTPYLGSLDAPAVLSDFFQFTCPHCNNFRATMHELLPYVEAGQLRLESRPLVNSNQMTLWPVMVSLCAEQQGPANYWLLHDYIFDSVYTEGSFALGSHRILQRAAVFGLDMDALNVCLADEAGTITLQTNLEKANEIGLTGVPTILLNGARIPHPDTGSPMSGGVPLPLVQDAIDAILEASGSE